MPIAYVQPPPSVQTAAATASQINSPPIMQSPLRAHQLVTNYAVNAVSCFFKAIQLAEGRGKI